MTEYIKREAIGKAYMDLCLAKSKLAKSRKSATFFQSDLLPETEPTTKELFRLVMAIPAADVAEVVRCRECDNHSEVDGQHYCKFWRMYCPDDSEFFCKAGQRKEADHETVQ